MPELPEVETVRRTLLPLVKGRSIKKVDVFYPKMVHLDLASFKSALENKKILDIDRKGKHLIFVLSDGLYLLSHLRMEGKFRLEKEGFIGQKHDLLYFHLNNGKVLIYNDVRKFGVFLLKDEQTLLTTPPLSELGKDPFVIRFEEFFALLQRKKGNIKEALLDQKTISGIGNIYADEILNYTQISPFRKANSISLTECKILLENARAILFRAIGKGGSTIRSFHPINGVNGKMQNSLWAYGREGKPCYHCGMPLKKTKLSGRGTTYCPHCQIPPIEKIVIGVTGPIASGKSTVSKYLEQKDYLRFDCDSIVHSLYEKKDIQKKLQKTFGIEVIKDGEVDRKLLLDIVSKNQKKKKELEEIIHPLVYKKIEEGVRRTPKMRIVLDAPLLFDTPLEKLCNATILVTAKKDLRLKRLKKRGVDVEKSLSLNDDFPIKNAIKKSTIQIETHQGSVLALYNKIDRIRFLR